MSRPGRRGGPCVHWGACWAGIGQLWWFLRPRGIAWVCLASYGLRYTTFFGGDGRYSVGFFNLWLARGLQSFARQGVRSQVEQSAPASKKACAHCSFELGRTPSCAINEESVPVIHLSLGAPSLQQASRKTAAISSAHPPARATGAGYPAALRYGRSCQHSAHSDGPPRRRLPS